MPDPEVNPLAANWPSRTWVDTERVSAGMMNAWRDQLNDLHAAIGVPAPWIDVPFNVADFWPGATAAGMGLNQYVIQGSICRWILYLDKMPMTPSVGTYMNIQFPPAVRGKVLSVFAPTSWIYEPSIGFSDGFIVAASSSASSIAKRGGPAWATDITLMFSVDLAIYY